MGTTGIGNRKAYIERLLKEDEKLMKENPAYGSYLTALTKLSTGLAAMDSNKPLTADQLRDIKALYKNVADARIEYLNDNSNDIVRQGIVEKLNKVVSRDMAVFNSMDEKKPGTLQDAFDQSRTARIVIAELEKKEKKIARGMTNSRIPVKNTDGTKGFFTARTDAARDAEWKELSERILKDHKNVLPKKIADLMSKAATEQNARNTLYSSVVRANGNVYDGIQYLLKDQHLINNDEKDMVPIMTNELLYGALSDVVKGIDRLVAPINLADRLGYDPYTRNDNKNAAMYDVAKFLGRPDLIAKAVPMVIIAEGKAVKGTFMEYAEGSDLLRPKRNEPLYRLSDNCTCNKNLYRDLADMQMIDYICGNVDRHRFNMVYKTEKREDGKYDVTGIKGIDNDAAFPEGSIDFDLNSRSAHIFRPENFRYVSRETADIVRNISRGQLEMLLRNHNLSQKAIDLAWERTQEVKAVLNEMEKNNLSYVEDLKGTPEDKAFEVKNEDRLKNGNKSIFSDFDVNLKQNAKNSYDSEFKKQKEDMFGSKLVKDPETGKEILDEDLMGVRDNQTNPIRKAADSSKAGITENLLADQEMLKGMESLIKRVNRMKVASSEFAQMRNAVYSAAKQADGLLKSGETIDQNSDGYKKYVETLKRIDEKTKAYIQAKALEPKTNRGIERLSAAESIENRIEDLLRALPREMKLDAEENVMEENEM